MVHISDAVLAPWLWVGGWLVTIPILVYALYKMKIEDVPKLSIITAAVFVASLIRIPAAITSVHFVMNGFAGVTLGLLAFPCIVVALTLQALMFQHGGVTTIGINAVNMGVPALISYLVFRSGMNLKVKRKEMLFGAIAGGIAVMLAVLFLAVELLATGDEFSEVMKLVVLAHIPLIGVEAIFTGVIAGFFAAVKPEMLSGWHK